MDFGDIESDPLKFCEDFKAFSEKNMDKYTSAQMKVQGTSPILACLKFWPIKFLIFQILSRNYMYEFSDF